MTLSNGTSTAPYGQKMIQVKLYFFTDTIAPEGQIRPGHATASGFVGVKSNPAHGIEGGEQIPFNRVSEILPAIEDALAKSGVTLHLDGPAKKLYEK